MSLLEQECGPVQPKLAAQARLGPHEFGSVHPEPAQLGWAGPA